LQAKNNSISFIDGSVEAVNENNNSVSIPQVNQTIQPNLLYGTGKGSRFEYFYNDVTWRVGSLSFVKIPTENSFFIHSGSTLFCTNDKIIDLEITSRNSKASFSGSGTIIIESLENGGFKIIPLEVDGFIKTDTDPLKELIGGRMLLVLGNRSYLANAYDIDILLLLQSSRLINNFPTPLSTFDQIGLAIYVQQLKLKGKYDALIGDAKTEKTLQIWGFGEKPNQ
jgi:hypothetical protein